MKGMLECIDLMRLHIVDEDEERGIVALVAPFLDPLYHLDIGLLRAAVL